MGSKIYRSMLFKTVSQAGNKYVFKNDTIHDHKGQIILLMSFLSTSTYSNTTDFYQNANCVYKCFDNSFLKISSRLVAYVHKICYNFFFLNPCFNRF